MLFARVAFVLLAPVPADKLKRLCSKPFVFVQLEKYAPSWAAAAVTTDPEPEDSEDSRFRANLAKVRVSPCVCHALRRPSCAGYLFQVLNVPTTRGKKIYLTPYQWRAAWDRLVPSTTVCRRIPHAGLVSAGMRSQVWLPSSSVTRTL